MTPLSSSDHAEKLQLGRTQSVTWHMNIPPVTGMLSASHSEVYSSGTRSSGGLKYLFRTPGNLTMQVTGLDKMVSQGVLQTCFL